MTIADSDEDDSAQLLPESTVAAINQFLGSPPGEAVSSSAGYLSAAISPAVGGLLIRTTDPGVVNSLIAGAELEFPVAVEEIGFSRVELIDLKAGVRGELGSVDAAIWNSHVDWETAQVVLEISSTASTEEIALLTTVVATYSGDATGLNPLAPFAVVLLDHPINTTPD